MIQTEIYKTRKDGVNLIRTWSDEDKKIRNEQTGVVYDEAIDVETAGYTYVETEENVDVEEEENEDEG